MTRTTQMIEVGRCITNKFQPRSRGKRSVEGLARNIQANGQLTPITVVADGEGAYQVVYGHRRLAAMKSIGERWIEAYVEDTWEDAVMARRLNAENYDRAEPTAGETAEGIQAMLQLGVPVTQVAASCSMDVTKVRDFARGAMRVPDADGAASFDALVRIGEHRDLLTDEDVDAIMAAPSTWRMDEVIRAAKGRAAVRELTAELESRGVRVAASAELEGGNMRKCGEDEQAQGIVAVVSSDYWGRASAVYYCEREQEPEREGAGGTEPDVVGIEVACAPSPEEVEAQRRFEGRREVARELYDHVTDYAKKIYRKFPSGRGHSKLRAWAHGAFAEYYGCEPDGAWAGVREQKSPAVDRFVLMRTVPQCLPDLPEDALREGAELHAWEADEAGAFLEFFADVMPFACYRPTEGEEELFAHLRRTLGIADDAETPEAEPAANQDGEGAGRQTCPIVELAEEIVAEAEAAETAPDLALAA